MLVIVGAISGAMALMLIGRAAAERDFLALSAGLAATVGLVGSVALPPATARSAAAAALPGQSPETVAEAAQLLAIGAPFLAVLTLGLPFVLAARPRAAAERRAARADAPAQPSASQPSASQPGRDAWPAPQHAMPHAYAVPEDAGFSTRRMAEIEMEERFRAAVRARIEAETAEARPYPAGPRSLADARAEPPEPPLRLPPRGETGGRGRFPRVWGG